MHVYMVKVSTKLRTHRAAMDGTGDRSTSRSQSDQLDLIHKPGIGGEPSSSLTQISIPIRVARFK